MRQKVKCDLVEVVVLAICAVMGGAETWEEIEDFAECKEDWLRGFLRLEHGIPSDVTIQRIFSIIDPHLLHASLLRWFEDMTQVTGGKFVAIDGKTLRASMDTASGRSALHLVSAWATEQSLLLG
jgi:hypothetical protein